MSCIPLALALCCLVGLAYADIDDSVHYENPVRSSAEDEIKNLPGLNEPITFRHYSGYLKADKKNKKFLHYWFVEAYDDPANKPVLLWLNGGPGCSSMEGLFSELGPFEFNSDGTLVKLRNYSWNKVANVIFLESPAGVGYSYTKSLINTESDDSTAQENYNALKSFFEKFPHYKNNRLYLSGESYAGVYLPTLGVIVDADKEINLKGIAIGNGYLEADKLTESLTFFAYYHGLYGKSFWMRVSHVCCGGLPPSRRNCDFGRVFCKTLVNDKISEIFYGPGFNAYNIYGDCPSSNLSVAEIGLTRGHVDLALREVMMNRHPDEEKPFEILKVERHTLSNEPPCFDGDNMINYLNEALVREAIHIPKSLRRWNACTTLAYTMKYPLQPGGLAPQIKKLIQSPRNLTLLVFNGDTDLVCNALGDEWFVDDLGQKIIKDYAPWKVDSQVAGFVKHFEGITYATVRGAGHMVPEFRPKEAFKMIQTVLNSTHQNVFL